MRICRYIPPDFYEGAPDLKGSSTFAPAGTHWGLVEGEYVQTLDRAPFEEVVPGKARYKLEDVTLQAPVQPGKIVAVGLNFEGHIREMGHDTPEEPLIFLKAPSTVIGPGEAIVMPPESSRVDYEGELALVVGKRCRRINAADAPEYILGYTILNDVTARDLQKKDGQFSRAKSFDTFCPMGPWIETELYPGDLKITTVVSSVLRQDDSTSSMLFDPHVLLEFISGVMTLEPGDVIATGTPSGVGPLAPGDEVSIAIEGIGVLSNIVVKEESEN
jgi:2-keto-4-pentenoate hydratase/2-oxohepta-3-ene-1,7-dioic acid hydratase in catechol pathway